MAAGIISACLPTLPPVVHLLLDRLGLRSLAFFRKSESAGSNAGPRNHGIKTIGGTGASMRSSGWPSPR